jgi:HD-GYP domain-containing protein (c-di-GMP phosphodiesterase class II)
MVRVDRTRSARPWWKLWLAGWVVLVAGEWAALRASTAMWEQPRLLFWLVVIAASGCVITSAAVIVRGWTSRVAETAALGAFFMAVSLLPLAHGLTVPGVLYGPNTATMATVFWAVPAGAVGLVPFVAPRSRWANALMVHWRIWIAAQLVTIAAVFAVALSRPNLIAVPAMGSTAAVLGVGSSILVCGALSYRHLRLAWLARRHGPLAVSGGAALVGASSLVFLGTGPWTPGFWLAHLLDIGGVFAATVMGAISYRRSGSVGAVLAPVEATTPLRALELGLDPLVHRFVAALDAKDPITRDHVVRSAQLAALVAGELGLAFDQLSQVTLGAILHDVGKLNVPDAVLNKPGRLNDAEYDIIKRHPIDGEALVDGSPALAGLGPIIRGHHERVDGNGYPDALAGDAIPIGARIVAVCDAYDAMSNTRQYRNGMGSERALAVLAEHSGSQWEPAVVDALTRVVRRRGLERSGDVLANVGRSATAATAPSWCGCGDALPAELVTT